MLCLQSCARRFVFLTSSLEYGIMIFDFRLELVLIGLTFALAVLITEASQSRQHVTPPDIFAADTFLRVLQIGIRAKDGYHSPEPVAIVAFPAATVVRTLARYGEVIGGIQERLLEMPTQRWEEIEEELLTLRERASRAETEGITLRARVRSLELIETWLHGL
ncbi:hypothetical protein Tco_0514192 [Tanacetum coccineum]